MGKTKQGKGNKAKKKKKSILPFLLLFIIGLGILSYPVISDFYYQIDYNSQISDFKNSKDQLATPEVEERMKLAQAYNDSLINKPTGDPFAEEMLKRGQAEYARMLEIKEKIGFVEVPSANISLPLYAGTSEEVLEKGAGHLQGTSLPIGGNSTHSVITGHSGIPKAKLFTDIHQVKVGDKFYIHNIKEVIAYQVDQIHTIEPTDFSELLVVPGHDYVTLLTCTPVGVNSHRLIVRGHRIPYDAPVEERAIAEHRASFLYKYLFYGAVALAILLLLGIILLYQKKQRYKKKLKAMELERQRQLQANQSTEGSTEENLKKETSELPETEMPKDSDEIKHHEE